MAYPGVWKGTQQYKGLYSVKSDCLVLPKNSAFYGKPEKTVMYFDLKVAKTLWRNKDNVQQYIGYWSMFALRMSSNIKRGGLHLMILRSTVSIIHRYTRILMNTSLDLVSLLTMLSSWLIRLEQLRWILANTKVKCVAVTMYRIRQHCEHGRPDWL